MISAEKRFGGGSPERLECAKVLFVKVTEAVEEGRTEKLPGRGADALALRRSQDSSPGMCDDMMNISAAHSNH